MLYLAGADEYNILYFEGSLRALNKGMRWSA